MSFGMLFWLGDDHPQRSLVLAHKDCRDRVEPNVDDLSAELSWFATHETALDRLADTSGRYAWSADDRQRLILLAWAVPQVANDEQKKDATHFNESF